MVPTHDKTQFFQKSVNPFVFVFKAPEKQVGNEFLVELGTLARQLAAVVVQDADGRQHQRIIDQFLDAGVGFDVADHTPGGLFTGG